MEFRKALIALLVLCFSVVQGLADDHEGSARDWQRWIKNGEVTSGLIGRIWSVADQVFIEPSELVERLADARFLLLGENHDNADHHRLQAFLLENVAPAQRPAVVMEMVGADRAKALDSFNASAGRTADAFREAVDWDSSGWPDFDLYRPVIDAALAREARIGATLPTIAATREVSKGGLDVLGADRLEALGLASPLAPDLTEDLEQEIIVSHCDMLPPEVVPNMTAVQRFRDAAIAEALREIPETGPAVLIAGNGHVRSDRGVPAYLGSDAGRAVVVMMQETGPDKDAAGDTADFGLDVPADYLWFTPPAEREDPCAALRERFSGHGKDG
jgi:uncharacterized iron-regulated protein